MIYRIYPSKDTFITNDVRRAVRMTGSNVGRSEELVVFKRSPISGAIGSLGSSSLGRSLLQFNFAEYSSLTGSNAIVSGTTYILRVNHKTSNDPLPSSFDVSIKPLSVEWDEGRGLDVVGLGDPGYANWIKRTQAADWTTAGGDTLTSPTQSFHFDTGEEDLETDVTNIVLGWLTGNVTNNGIALAMTASIESDSVYVNYYTKKFYSRQSGYDDRKPYIEARAYDFVGDDRSNMKWDRTGSLYMYNIVNGQLTDLPQTNIYVTINDLSGSKLFLTASHGRTGIYSASFALPTGSYSGSIFYDRWGSGSFALMSGSFTLASEAPVSMPTVDPLTARVKNLRTEYVPEDAVRFDVLFKKIARTVHVRSTATLNPIPYIVETCFYAIENESTRERVIPFGTGSLQHTRLSYDGNGNYFDFRMTNLHAGNVYRILFLVDEQGRRQVIDEGIKFKIV